MVSVRRKPTKLVVQYKVCSISILRARTDDRGKNDARYAKTTTIDPPDKRSSDPLFQTSTNTTKSKAHKCRQGSDPLTGTDYRIHRRWYGGDDEPGSFSSLG